MSPSTENLSASANNISETFVSGDTQYELDYLASEDSLGVGELTLSGQYSYIVLPAEQVVNFLGKVRVRTPHNI